MHGRRSNRSPVRKEIHITWKYDRRKEEWRNNCKKQARKTKIKKKTNTEMNIKIKTKWRGVPWYMIWYTIYDMIWQNMIWYDMIYDIWYDMTWYDIWRDMIWYDMIWYDMIWYDMIWYDIWYDMIYDMIYLTAIGLTPGGSSTVNIHTQTIHRTT